MFCRRFVMGLALLPAFFCTASLWGAAPNAKNGTPAAPAFVETRTGTFQVTNWYSPNNADCSKSITALFERFGWTMPKDTGDDLIESIKEFDPVQNAAKGKKTSAQKAPPAVNVAQGNNEPPLYTVYVPKSYKAGQPYGLFVWICAEDNPTDVPEGWAEVLDAHHLIWIAPHNVGNDTGNAWRAYMALETLRNALQAFTIDEERIYVGGFSDGARTACEVGQVYPDTFKGAFCCEGASFYKEYAGVKGSTGGFWSRPNSAMIDLDRKISRFVLMDVAKNSSFKNTRCVEAAMEMDGFKSATFLEAPSANHWAPPGDDFNKGVVLLDVPLTAAAERQYKEAQAAEKIHHLGVALSGYTVAAFHGGIQHFVADAQARADALKLQFDAELTAIDKLINDKQFDKAVASARALQDKWNPYFTKDKFQGLIRLINDARAAKH